MFDKFSMHKSLTDVNNVTTVEDNPSAKIFKTHSRSWLKHMHVLSPYAKKLFRSKEERLRAVEKNAEIQRANIMGSRPYTPYDLNQLEDIVILQIVNFGNGNIIAELVYEKDLVGGNKWPRFATK